MQRCSFTNKHSILHLSMNKKSHKNMHLQIYSGLFDFCDITEFESSGRKRIPLRPLIKYSIFLFNR